MYFIYFSAHSFSVLLCFQSRFYSAFLLFICWLSLINFVLYSNYHELLYEHTFEYCFIKANISNNNVLFSTFWIFIFFQAIFYDFRLISFNSKKKKFSFSLPLSSILFAFSLWLHALPLFDLYNTSSIAWNLFGIISCQTYKTCI